MKSQIVIILKYLMLLIYVLCFSWGYSAERIGEGQTLPLSPQLAQGTGVRYMYEPWSPEAQAVKNSVHLSSS